MMEDALRVNMNDYLPLRDVVFNTLRQAILKGEFQPGERLMEIQLAQRLGVSRTPIREAIRKLELEGLVVMIPRKGAEVARITEKSMRDVLEVRLALEKLSMELACQRITEEEIRQLEVSCQEFGQSTFSKDLLTMAEADERFHDVIYNATKNKRLIQMLNNLREQMYRYRIEYIKDIETHEGLVEEHEEILRALKEKDLESASSMIQNHIENQTTAISGFIHGQN